MDVQGQNARSVDLNMSATNSLSEYDRSLRSFSLLKSCVSLMFPDGFLGKPCKIATQH